MTSIQPNYVPTPCDIWRPQTITSMPTPSPLSSAEDEVRSSEDSNSFGISIPGSSRKMGRDLFESRGSIFSFNIL